MLGDLLGNQKWVGILLELQQKLDRDLVLNCKILSSNIIAILFALLHTDYRKSIWGQLAHLVLHQGRVGRSVLDLGSDSAVPDLRLFWARLAAVNPSHQSVTPYTI